MDYTILLQPPYNIFTIVALFTLGLSLLEILMFFFGLSFDNFINLDSHSDLDLDLDLDIENDISIYSYDSVNLLNLGKVPFLVILLSLSSSFSFFGFGTHYLAQELGTTISNLIAVPFSVGLSLFFTNTITIFWKKIFSDKNSVAISEKSFIGKIGTINLGTATNKNSVEISLYDERNMKHYIMGQVALPNITIAQNSKVFIIHKKKNGNFLVLPYLEQIETIENNMEKNNNFLTQESNTSI
jgi:hypothetical protein